MGPFLKFCDRCLPRRASSSDGFSTLCGSLALFVNFSSSLPSSPFEKATLRDKVYILYAPQEIPRSPLSSLLSLSPPSAPTCLALFSFLRSLQGFRSGGEVTFDNSPFSLALFSFAPLGRVSPSCQCLSLSFSIGIRSDAPLPLRLSNPSSSSQ